MVAGQHMPGLRDEESRTARGTFSIANANYSAYEVVSFQACLNSSFKVTLNVASTVVSTTYRFPLPERLKPNSSSASLIWLAADLREFAKSTAMPRITSNFDCRVSAAL